MQGSAFQKLAGNTTALLSHFATGSLLLTSKMLSDVNLCDPNLTTHLPRKPTVRHGALRRLSVTWAATPPRAAAVNVPCSGHNGLYYPPRAAQRNGSPR